MKILLWGAGADAVRFHRLRNCYTEIFNDDIVAVIDKNSDKWGGELFEREIVAPTEFKKLQWDRVLISSTQYDAEIRNELTQHYNVDAYFIVGFTDYCRQKVISYQYNKNVQKNSLLGKCNNFQPFNAKSLVVYTAIIGDYDELKDPVVVEPGVHYVCFTDQRNVNSDVWEIRHIDGENEEPAVCVRKYKMLPHKFFPDYDTSIWVDASMQIIGNLVELIETYQKNANILLMPHDTRICAYDEAFANVTWLLSSKKLVIPQIYKYKSEGFPVDNGLMIGAFLARNHRNNEIVKTMEDWFHEVNSFSRRDQISLPYALWKNSLPYDLCNLYVFDNPWMIRCEHKHIQDFRGSGKQVLSE